MPWKRLLAIVAPIADMIPLHMGRKNKHAATHSAPEHERQVAGPTSNYSTWIKQLIVGQTQTACEQANRLDRKYFALGNAPHLPLEGCNSERCQCWYKFQPELRSGQDRRLGLERRIFQRAKAKYDRRYHSDRRNFSSNGLRHEA